MSTLLPEQSESGLRTNPDSARRLIQAAIEMRPRLVERQAETESLGGYPQQTHEEFLANGLYRVLQPRGFGGYECDLSTFLAIVRELARGCPSTAWCYAFGVTHQYLAAMVFPEETQREIFADGTCLIACTAVPGPQRATRVEGGFRVSGTFAYASGSPYSTHYLGNSLPPEGETEPLMFLLPRSEYTLLSDWSDDVLGMRGSGSNSIQVTDAFVPDAYVLRRTIRSLDVVGGSVGATLHANPMYALPTLTSLSSAVIISVGMGAGWAAFDEYLAAMTSRRAVFTTATDSSGKPPFRSEVEEFQGYLGDAFGKLASAEAVITRVGQFMNEFCEQNVLEGGVAPYADDQLVAMLLNAVEAVWGTVQSPLASTIGTTHVLRRDERMQRYVRDIQAVWSHRVVSYQRMNSVFLGRAILSPTDT